MTSAIEAIKIRVSCRTFSDRPVEPETAGRLRDVLLAGAPVPFGGAVRFQLLDLNELEREEIRTLGTYGVIKGARLFLAGAVRGRKPMEDFGYAMERNILAATGLGLGTCWLGGTFNRSGFAGRMNLQAGELLPAVSPVGYPAGRRSMTERIFRFGAGSGKRKPWGELFFAGDFMTPLDEDHAGRYTVPLACVRLGPSASNRQPWRILKDQERDVFHFYLKRTPGYDRVFGDVNLQNVDMGIALCHFELAAEELGLPGSWREEEPDIPSRDLEYIASWVGKT